MTSTFTARIHVLNTRKSALVRALEFPEDWRENAEASRRNSWRRREIARYDAEILDILLHREETK